MRQSKCSVTIFLKHQDKYLVLLRSATRVVDANRLNGIGGKLEPGENYLAAAVRETQEETGFEIAEKDFKFAGFIRIEGGYPEDWLVAFFCAPAPSAEVPTGMNISEGELKWLTADEVLQGPYELVDDLHYLFPLIVQNKDTFFASAIVNSQEKIESIQINSLPCHN